MKIAFTSKGENMDSQVDARFGRCDYILVFDDATEALEVIDNKDSSQEAHGAGPKTAQKIFNTDIDVLITGNGPGGNAKSVLERKQMDIYIGAADKTIREALDAFKNNLLEKF